MSKYYFVGSGVASLAGAAYLIRDGHVDGSDIVLFEEAADYGGALDAHGDAASGYFMSGSRMFESKYNCTFELLSSIPSASNPAISVTEETNLVRAENSWNARARLVDLAGNVTDAHPLGFDGRDRVDLLAIVLEPEAALNSKRIRDCFAPHFFQSNFWYEWCTLFAFQPWHSAIEFQRYLLRFMHHFSTIDTQQGIYRTHSNQYESIAAPLVAWLRAHGVTFRFGTTVTNLEFRNLSGKDFAVRGLSLRAAGAAQRISVAAEDRVFVTNGSMTAGKAFGSMSAAPVVDRTTPTGAWKLWETLAQGRSDFGNPAAFNHNVPESVWESFSVTVSEPLFLERMQAFTGSVAGRGGLTTFKDSNWLITLSMFHQPFFASQPPGVSVWWGYGLYFDQPGNFVRKTMAECTGREILEEVLGHLRFDDDREAILAASNVIPCVMPYITSQFSVRRAGDRPQVVPRGSKNLAFIGQYCEQPNDVVFTVEYSIRSAQRAVYTLLDLDLKLTPMYKGAHDPRVLFEALGTVGR
jgi:oleate hydratase